MTKLVLIEILSRKPLGTIRYMYNYPFTPIESIKKLVLSLI